MPAPVVVAEIVRSGFVEGHHYGSLVALAADGSVEWSVGDAESQIFPRSCNKPVQAVAMLRAGLELDGELLALAAASHSGETFHLEGVRRILDGAGLDESALQTPPDYPIDDAARDDYIRAGGVKAPITMNCSGKHAAMLATCVVNGWDTATYLQPDHPLQVVIAETFAELTGEPVKMAAVDGCGRRCSPRRWSGWPAPSARSPSRPRAPSAGSPTPTGRTPSTPPAPVATRPACSAPSPGRSARPVPSPATRSACRTGARSRSRPTTARPGCVRC